MTYETARGYEWDVNDAGGSCEIELEYEYPCGTMCFSTATSYLFLSRADLVAMLEAIDE